MNVKSSDTPSAHFPIERTSTWMDENFKWFLNGFIILLHSIHVRLRCKTLCKATLLTSDKQSTGIVPQQVKTQGSSHWKAMSQNWMMWKVDLPAMTFLKHTFVARCYTLPPFFLLWRKTDRIQWIPCVHFLLWFYAKTREKNGLNHFCIEIFL